LYFILLTFIYFILIYVDNIIVSRTNSTAISNLIQSLIKEFVIKDLRPLHFFWGIHVTQSTSGLHLSQSKHIADLLERSNMVGAKPSKTPIPTNTKIFQHDDDPLENAI